MHSYKNAQTLAHSLPDPTDSGFADNKYCFNLVLLWIFNFMVIVLISW